MENIVRNDYVASIQNQKVAIYDSYRKIITLISNKPFKFVNLKSSIFFGSFVYYKYFIIFVVCFICNALKMTFFR